MNKSIYSLLNNAEMNSEDYDNSPLSNEEVNNIMKRISNQTNTVTKKKSNRKSVIFGLAAAAACFAGVIGVSVNMSEENISKGDNIIIADSQVKKENSFFITAGAEETENSTYLTFEKTGGEIPFSGSVFFVEGNNIETVDISIDKGSLYKADFSKTRQMKDGEIVESSDSCEYIGNAYSEKYNADRCFGFYFDEKAYEAHANEIGEDNLKAICHACYDDFDGGVLTVSVTYTDSTSESTEYTLTSGKLEINPDTMKPNGNFTDGSKQYIYGLMMKKEN